MGWYVSGVPGYFLTGGQLDPFIYVQGGVPPLFPFRGFDPALQIAVKPPLHRRGRWKGPAQSLSSTSLAGFFPGVFVTRYGYLFPPDHIEIASPPHNTLPSIRLDAFPRCTFAKKKIRSSFLYIFFPLLDPFDRNALEMS